MELFLKDFCSNTIIRCEVYSVKIKDTSLVHFSKGTNDNLKVPYLGVCEVSSSLHLIKDREIVLNRFGLNRDIINIPRIYKCVEPTTRHNSFVGYCSCGEKINGYEVDFYFNGNKRIEGKFKEGVPIGAVIKYYQSGNIQEIARYNKKGKLKKVKYYQ